MPLTLTMQTSDEFVPEHDDTYIVFDVSDFYNKVTYRTLRCEFYYGMIDAEDGAPLSCSVIYNKEKGKHINFNHPVLFDKDENPYYLDYGEMEERERHPDETQRFWWVKTYQLYDIHGGMYYLNPEDIDENTLGIIKEEDFFSAIREANKERHNIKYGE